MGRSAPSAARTLRTPAGKRSRLVARQTKPAELKTRFQSTGRIVKRPPRSGGVSTIGRRPMPLEVSHHASLRPAPLDRPRLSGAESAVISGPSQRRPRRRTPVRRGRRREKVAKAQCSRRPQHTQIPEPSDSSCTCRPHSLVSSFSHHQRPERGSSPAPTARVQGSQPTEG